MNKKTLFIMLLLLTFASLSLLGLKKYEPSQQKLAKVTTNDNYNYIDINQILMYISNNGDGSHDPVTDGQGFFWPGGKDATIGAIFEDGLIWGGKIGREIRVGGSTYRHGLQAGKILPDGTADDPSNPRYRVFKIRKDWKSLPPDERGPYEKDYNEWPVQDGAPWVDVDGDGVFTRGVDKPDFVGDEVLWCVSNDLDVSRTTFLYGTAPMGLEVQQTVFGFNRKGDLGDMVFKKYRLINKGTNTIKQMYLAYWSDTDLGDAGDDFTGCDTALSLGYTYNGDNDDAGFYGVDPPAVGYDFFQGPIVPALGDSAKFGGRWIQNYKNLGLTSFSLYINGDPVYKDPDLGVPEGSVQMYNYMTSRLYSGEPFVDPNTGKKVKFVVPGDPYYGTGWYEGPGWKGGRDPGDRRHVMSSGPFTMAPGDTQEVTVGILIARAPGEGNLAAVRELKRKDKAAQLAYDLDFKLTPAPPAPKMRIVTGDRKVTLYWETNAEDYEAGDPLLFGKGIDDTTYNFEGYRIWQFQDQSGANPKLLNVNDLADGIKIIYDAQTINGINTVVPVIKSPDDGLIHSLTITQDAYSNSPLRDGSPYYFGITSYGYSPNSTPTYLESSPVIKEARPATKKIDESYTYDADSKIIATQTSGDGYGNIWLNVVDPEVLNGHTYTVSLMGPDDDLSYDFVDQTSGDTLIKDSKNFSSSDSGVVIDGFQLVVNNAGADSLAAIGRFCGIQSIDEIKGPGGIDVNPPVNVNNHLNSTGDWELVPRGFDDARLSINWKNNVGYDNYEIRFTNSGSEYYISGYKGGFRPPPYLSDPKAKGKLPFEIWNVGRDLNSTADDIRLTLKVLDYDKSHPEDTILDSTYSQLPNGDWEPVFAYFSNFNGDSVYSEPLPDVSGNSKANAHILGNIVFKGDLPKEGTVIRITTWRPLSAKDAYQMVATAPNKNDLAGAKARLNKISVFPNPYFGASALETNKYQRFVRFTNLPKKVTARIYSLAGVFIKKIEKNNDSQWLDWNLHNKNEIPVGSGIYIVHLDMPGIGTKILKLAIVQEQQYIDRL